MIDDGTWQELLDKNVGASGYKANDGAQPADARRLRLTR